MFLRWAPPSSGSALRNHLLPHSVEKDHEAGLGNRNAAIAPGKNLIEVLRPRQWEKMPEGRMRGLPTTGNRYLAAPRASIGALAGASWRSS
jgi:hypothetical protein